MKRLKLFRGTPFLTFNNRDSEAPSARFLVLHLHIKARFEHRENHLVKRHVVMPVAQKRQARGVYGFDCGHGVSFNAGNLHLTRDRITGHTEVMLHADFSGVFNLLRRGTQNLGKATCGHRAGNPHFTLATHFSARDRGVFFVENADLAFSL